MLLDDARGDFLRFGLCESVESGGIDGFEFGAKGEGHALDLDINEAGFDGCLAAQPPEGGGHFADETVLNEVS